MLAQTPENNRTALIGYLMVFLAALAFSLIGPITRYPLAHGVSPVECAFWRAFFGGVFFVIHGVIIGAWKITPKQRAVFSLFGIPGVGLLFFMYMFAVHKSGAATTSVLNNTAPIWVAVWAYLFLREMLTGRKIFCILLAVGGAALLSISGGRLAAGATTWGVAAAVASGFLYSLHAPLAKKFQEDGVSAVSIYMYILLAGALALLPFVTFMPDKSPLAWGSLIGMGLLCNWVPYLCFCAALKRLSATRVAVLETASEPFMAALFAFLWWGEAFTPLGWLGACLVIGAVVLVILSKDKLRPAKIPALENLA